jgi:hypothetical protein
LAAQCRLLLIMKYKVTIKHVTVQEHEMELESESIMEAFDEALELVTVRNNNGHPGRFFVAKISETKEK